MAAPTVTLAPNALIDLATVLGELGLGSDPSGNPVTRLINAVSAAAESYCSRKFALGTWTDLIAAKDPGPMRFVLRNVPVWQAPFVQAYPLGTATTGAPMYVSSDNDPGNVGTANANQPVTGGGMAMAFGTDYYLEDSDAGFLARQDRWWTSAIRQLGVVQDFDSTQVEKTYQCNYVGGYLTIPQLSAAAGWASGTAALLQLVIPAAHTSQLWICALAGATGATEPTWPASPVVGNTTTGAATSGVVIDGSALWAYIGSQSQPGAQPSSKETMRIPYDLESAAIEWAVMMYRRRGQSLEPSVDKFGNASQTYTPGGRIFMPPGVREVLDRYKFIACG